METKQIRSILDQLELCPLLAVKWIEAGHGVAPMAFTILVDRVIADSDRKDGIARLVEARRLGSTPWPPTGR